MCPPTGRGLGLTSMTAPALLGSSQGGVFSEGRRAAWSPSVNQRKLLGVEAPGSITTGQTFLGDHLQSAISVCFPNDSGTALMTQCWWLAISREHRTAPWGT